MKKIAVFVFAICLLCATNVVAEEYKITLSSKRCISEIILTVFLPPDWEIKEIYPEQFVENGEITFVAPPELVAGYEFNIIAIDEVGDMFWILEERESEGPEIMLIDPYLPIATQGTEI